eukprot:jgi/Bigna1/80912/fgenesh1_pg.75_\
MAVATRSALMRATWLWMIPFASIRRVGTAAGDVFLNGGSYVSSSELSWRSRDGVIPSSCSQMRPRLRRGKYVAGFLWGGGGEGGGHRTLSGLLERHYYQQQQHNKSIVFVDFDMTISRLHIFSLMARMGARNAEESLSILRKISDKQLLSLIEDEEEVSKYDDDGDKNGKKGGGLQLIDTTNAAADGDKTREEEHQLFLSDSLQSSPERVKMPGGNRTATIPPYFPNPPPLAKYESRAAMLKGEFRKLANVTDLVVLSRNYEEVIEHVLKRIGSSKLLGSFKSSKGMAMERIRQSRGVSRNRTILIDDSMPELQDAQRHRLKAIQVVLVMMEDMCSDEKLLANEEEIDEQ